MFKSNNLLLRFCIFNLIVVFLLCFVVACSDKDKQKEENVKKQEEFRRLQKLEEKTELKGKEAEEYRAKYNRLFGIAAFAVIISLIIGIILGSRTLNHYKKNKPTDIKRRKMKNE